MSSIINESPKINTIDIDGSRIVVVDDFLSEPETLRRYAIRLSKVVRHIAVGVGYELYPSRGEFDELYPDFVRSLTCLVHKLMNDNIKSDYELNSDYTRLNLWKGPLFNCVYKLPAFTPHVDLGHVSTFIYLTAPERCSGGTGIYRHLPTGKMHCVQDTCGLDHMLHKPMKSALNYSTDEWELLHKVDMKNNRLVMISSSIIHKIFFEPEGHLYAENIEDTRLALNNFFVYSSDESVPGNLKSGLFGGANFLSIDTENID